MAAALTAAGHTSDVYDFDTQGRKAPHHLGVLSHYEAVLWETGDDIILRAPGQVAGHHDEGRAGHRAVGPRLPQRGRQGCWSAASTRCFAQSANGAYFYNPNAPAEPECTDPDDPVCLPVLNDFLQYWLGAYTYIDGGGTDADGNAYPLAGIADPFTGWDGRTLDENQDHTASFLPTSSFLPPAEFPWFGPSSAPVDWGRPGAAPFEPHTGDWHLFSGQADVSYKRLTRTVDLTGADQRRSCSSSPRTRPRPTGTTCSSRRTWSAPTTGPRCRTPTATPAPTPASSCPEGWNELHPFLAHYQRQGATARRPAPPAAGTRPPAPRPARRSGRSTCPRTPASRSSCRSRYVSDWGTQGLGVFLDDVSVTVDGATVAETSFETDLGGWTVAGPPAGSAPNTNDWARSQLAYEEGAVTVTTDTIYTGFGLEGLSAAERDDFVTRSMQHLLGGAPTAVRPGRRSRQPDGSSPLPPTGG